MSLTVEGYVTCSRGQHAWVLAEVARRTGGICGDCFAAEGSKIPRELEVVGHQARLYVPLGKNRARRCRKPTEARKHRKSLVKRARSAARQRMSDMLPDLYDRLYAEERAALGLDPWPVEMAVRAGPDPDAERTLAFIEELQRGTR